jgi:hypothetical protein
MISVSPFMDGLGAFFQSNVCYDGRRRQDVRLPVLGMSWYPHSTRILFSVNNSIALSKPFFGTQQLAPAHAWIQQCLDKVKNSFICSIAVFDRYTKDSISLP